MIRYNMQGKLLFVIFSIGFAGLLEWLEKYIFGDWEYLTFLLILMLGDTFLGVYNAFKQRNVSSRCWGRIIDKIIVYFSLLIVCHILAEFTIGGEDVFLFKFAKYLGYSVLIVKESISILENINRISGTFVPKWLVARLKHFEKTGKIDEV